MTTNRIPYRLQLIYDDLLNGALPPECKVTVEDLDETLESARFPFQTFDTVRIFIRRGDFNVNVAGSIQQGMFSYQVVGYNANDEPVGDIFFATIDRAVDVVSNVQSRF